MGKRTHYAEQADRRPLPVCPTCGGEAIERMTRFGRRNSCCGLWSWDRHRLVDAATHQARHEAHVAFDALWRDGLLARGDAYQLLAEELNLDGAQCHMKLMDYETAKRVPIAAAAIAAAPLRENADA